ncbi:hypothetical protein Nepgr_001672 [Nepenthes gracilis]|uniref:J domain-containing protein n=1 Tax=Nepenthes gracilis TaxID=150966 RepID=A0AAD3P5I3_NEPGR|nr:hypothetical protein Nepgr_001672 [Nepenthes gracilis]
MNDFNGLLSSDYGIKPQGKSAPMAPPKPNPTTNSPFNFEIGGTTKATSLSKSSSGSFLDDHDSIFRSLANSRGFDSVLSDNMKSSMNSSANLESIFSGPSDSRAKFSSLPAFDKPVYDDDVLDGFSGLNSSRPAKYEDIFYSSAKKSDASDELLGSFGLNESEFKGSGTRGADKEIPSDDLLPGFGCNTAQNERRPSDSSWSQNSTANASKKTSSVVEDPFVVLESTSPLAPLSSGLLHDPFEQISNLNSSTKKAETSASRGIFDDIDPFNGLGKSVPAFSSEINDREKDGSPLMTGQRTTERQTSASESNVKSTVRSPEKTIPAEDYRDSPRNVFDMPSVSTDSHRSVPNMYSPSYVNACFNEANSQDHVPPRSEENMDSSDDIWLSVSETPPPRPAIFSRAVAGSFAKSNVDEYSAFAGSTPFFQSPKSGPSGTNNSFVSPLDELEGFAMGKSHNHVNGSSEVLSDDDVEANSISAASAAAMKEAMDRAEAKFRHAREVRERENAKAAGMRQERGEKSIQDDQEREFRERQRLEQEWQQREREEEERRKREEEEGERRQREEEERRKREEEEEERRQREEEERIRIEREKEEKEIEQRRLERDRELARKAVERATREARERAAAEARTRAERAALEKARERVERAAVQRALAEARERAAREAKDKAEKAAAEAREREKTEAREKEARERSAAASAAAKENQQNNEDDIESFFSMGSRASSAPRPRASTSDRVFDARLQSKQAPEVVRPSVGSTSSVRKQSSSASMVDDLSSIFGAFPSPGVFHEVQGETVERRRARMERHQRTQERAANALAEKNQRDLQAQREQAERHTIAETLDVEIKRWAVGKEGNLRALLSTLQYVLWPESGWQTVSLTDLITAANVRKFYRKAALCIHPDKVQQKGATLQQKYIAEKVFDLLKEAWNKFNSEELF